MKSSYLCPHCRAILNPRRKIIMVLSRKNSNGLVLFSDEVGDSTVYRAEDVEIAEGEKVDFLCPCCHKSLGSPVADDFGEVIKQDPDGTTTRVNFSRIFGKQATFVIGKGEVQSFGDDATAFQETNWFGAGRSWDEQL